MKLAFLILLIVVLNSTEILSNDMYEGRLFLKNKTIINAERITITEDSLYYNDLVSTNRYNISKNELNKLKVQDGNYKVLGLITGGLVGFTSYYLIISSDKFDTKESIYSSIVGLFLGGVIGELTSKSYDIYFGRNISMNTSTHRTIFPFADVPAYQTINFSINL